MKSLGSPLAGEDGSRSGLRKVCLNPDALHAVEDGAAGRAVRENLPEQVKQQASSHFIAANEVVDRPQGGAEMIQDGTVREKIGRAHV